MNARMSLAYSDPTPTWAPFVLVLLTTGGTWCGTAYELHSSPAQASKMSLVLLVVLLVGVFLQGLLYWKGQVETLTIAGDRAEAVTMRWVGWGKRYAFSAAETSDWVATPKHDDATKLSTISFRVRGGEKLSLSFLSPKVADLALLRPLAPAFFGKVSADYKLPA